MMIRDEAPSKSVSGPRMARPAAMVSACLLLVLVWALSGAAAAEPASSGTAERPDRAASAPISPEASAGYRSEFAGRPLSGMDMSDTAVRGQLRPVRHTVLAAGLTGQIRSFDPRPGSRVEEGQVLVEMVCDEVEGELAMAEARVAAAAARHAVNGELAGANNISTLEVDLGRAELAIARADRARIGARAEYCTIHAPFDGVIVEKAVQAHQHVAAGEPLLELVDNSELEVEVAVPSVWIREVATGARFEIDLDEADITLRGRFVRSVGRIDPVSQTLRVIGELENAPADLLAGMSGTVRLSPDG